MENRWSLNELYESFDSEGYKADFETYKNLITEITVFAADNFKEITDAAKKLEGYFKLYLEVSKYAETLLSYSYLILAVDVMNETAAKQLDILEELSTALTEPDVAALNFIAKIDDLDKTVASSAFLSEHEFVINEMKEQTKHLLSPAEELVIAKMETTGSGAWEKLRDQVTATLGVDITVNGEAKTEPLTVIRNYAHSADGELRKNAYESELKAYEKIDKPVAACLNAIKGEVLTISKMRRYESPLDMTLKNARMDRETLESLLSAIKKYLPVFRKYLKHKAKLLGKDSLPFYDLFAPVGKADMKYTYSEAKDFVYENFSSFSKRLGDFAKRAFDNKWIDVYPREGKTGGAFCSSIHPINESRIMLNFGGTFSDVTTIAHELGHGYHNECLNGLSYLNCHYTMPIAETASTFCETIVINSALKGASKEEATAIIDADLTDATQVIVDIYSRFLFESKVFEQRANGSASVNELKEIMLWAQREAYGDGLDENLLHPYAWAPKSHYYYAHSNFYNFPYAYGLLFSKGLYAKYLNEGASFTKDYDNLLAATGRDTLRGVGLKAGIDVREESFWVSSLKLIEEEIERFTLL
ncbi:MAG: M3 family oligoendopeptidase [Clostridiales bacterium]|jgi:pepF/M3 family oligoendopeptidase|nr:M3 family oligoendopeptidase [Clostridiales bacterium]